MNAARSSTKTKLLPVRAVVIALALCCACSSTANARSGEDPFAGAIQFEIFQNLNMATQAMAQIPKTLTPPAQNCASPAQPAPQSLTVPCNYSSNPQVQKMVDYALANRKPTVSGYSYRYIKDALYAAHIVPDQSLAGNANSALPDLLKQGFENLLNDPKNAYLKTHPEEAPEGSIVVYSGDPDHTWSAGGDIQIRTAHGWVSDYYTPRSTIRQTTKSGGRFYADKDYFHVIGVMIDPALENGSSSFNCSAHQKTETLQQALGSNPFASITDESLASTPSRPAPTAPVRAVAAAQPKPISSHSAPHSTVENPASFAYDQGINYVVANYSKYASVQNMMNYAEDHRLASSEKQCYHFVKQAVYAGGMAPSGSLPSELAVSAVPDLERQGFVNLLNYSGYQDLASNPDAAPVGAIVVYSGLTEGDVQIHTGEHAWVSDYFSRNAMIHQISYDGVDDSKYFHVIGVMIDPNAASIH